jgi:hypothetical protein
VSPVVTTVPVTFGIVIVRSAVGSTTVKVVSNPSAVAPSKTTPEPSTTGEVKVLLVNVCVPVSVTYPDNDGISEVRAIVPVVFGRVRVLSCVGSTT